ncbi:transposase, partial [Candidatus Pacearchaeota archaeon CG10_big_fil_rev_8_21_14_0_10_35_13]
MITTKCRLYPNKQQTEKLDFALDICRQAYNIMLGELKDQAVIDRNMIQAILPDLKICESRFREVYSKTLQYECYKLFSNLSALSALKKQGRKVGQLKFQGKKFFTTMTYNQSGFELEHT